MAKKVTLYIEDTDIKLLVTSGKQVEKWASLLLEPELVRDGVIIDEERVADGIKTMFRLEGISNKKINVGLGGHNSIFRIISLPELSQSMLPEAVMNEAGRVIPVPLDQVYLSYQQIPSPKGETHVFLVAYPRNSADTLIRTLIEAGLKPQTMELAPLALCRCANVPRAVIINSWLTYLDIVIMSDGIPQVIRSMSLPIDTAALKEKLPAITEELNRTIAFYNSSYPEAPLDSSVPIFVCGDLAEEPDSWESLVGESGYPVSALQPPAEYPEGFSPCKFMVNIGLALKGQLPRGDGNYYSIIDIDAMPSIYKPPGISLVRILVPVAVVVALGAVAWGGYFVKGEYDDTADLRSGLAIKELQVEKKDIEVGLLHSTEKVLQSQVTSIESDNEVLLEKIVDWEEMVAQQTEANLQPIEAEVKANSMEIMLASLTQGLAGVDDYLEEIVNLVPEMVTLLNVNYSDGSASSIQGLAPTEGDIFTYAKALRSSVQFSTITISSITETKRSEVGEEITVYKFIFLLE
ncbi:pilus assembly protein PilM [Chloroflexota bacterium]